jgi:hypothetical protein
MTESTCLLFACETDRGNKENSVADTKRVVDLVSRCRQLVRELGSTEGRISIDFTEDTYDLLAWGDPREDGPDGSISSDPELQALRSQGQRAR